MKRHHLAVIATILLLSTVQAYCADSTTIAVLDLKSTTVEPSLLIPLANRLSSEIVNTGSYTVVERGEMESILKEQGFQQTGCTDANCAVQAGQLLNVQYIIAGSVDKLGAIYSINIRMVNVGTGKIVRSVNDDCVDCSIDDFVMKTVRRAALKLVGLDAADKADDKVSDALKVQHFLYKGNRSGKLGSITIGVKPVQSHVVFDDSVYGSGSILIENVPAKRHHYEILPEQRSYIPEYGAVRVEAGEIAEMSVGLRKRHFIIGAGYTLALFDGTFTLPADSFIISYVDTQNVQQFVPVTKGIDNRGTVPSTHISAMIGFETPRSYYSLRFGAPVGNAFGIPDRTNREWGKTGSNHGSMILSNDTLYYATFVDRSYSLYFSYLWKAFKYKDIVSLNTGLQAGCGITRTVVDFYRLRVPGGRDYVNYNKQVVANESPSLVSTSSLSNPDGFYFEADRKSESLLKINQYDFGGPQFMAMVFFAPAARLYVHYMLGLGTTDSDWENVKTKKFIITNQFQAGILFDL